MNTEQTQTTGARIRSARKASGLSQSALAEKIGSTKQTIYKYENDMITNIPLDKLKAIAASLSIPPDDLLGWKNKSEEETTLLLKSGLSPEKALRQFYRIWCRKEALFKCIGGSFLSGVLSRNVLEDEVDGARLIDIQLPQQPKSFAAALAVAPRI